MEEKIEVKGHITSLIALALFVGGIVAFDSYILPMCYEENVAYTCPQNDITTLESHTVTFVVTDM